MKFLQKNRRAVTVLVVSILFFAFGVWRGEHEIVLRKAINICLECIGIG